jgi:hypothetical protein
MFERSNKVTNVGKVQFTQLFLDMLQLFTLEEFQYVILIIMKQVTCQEGLRVITKIFASCA